MAHVFVTGATGLVGRAAVEQLEAAGHRVTGLSRSGSADRPGDLAGDLLAPASYRAALAGVDAVVHLAAVTGKVPVADYRRVNEDGTRLLVEASRSAGVRRFVFCSSIAAGFPDRRRYHYAESKLSAEQIVAASGLSFTIIRPTIVAGPGSPVIDRLSALSRLPVIPAFGGARVRVQPIDSRDLAGFITSLVPEGEFDGDTLDLGGPDIVTMRELLLRLRAAHTDRPASFLPVPLGAMVAVLGVAETMAYGLVPVTVGQLATFRFDGTARPNRLWEARRNRLRSLDAMIAPEVPA